MCVPPRCRCAQAKFRVNHHCKVLCRIGSLNKAQVKAFESRIGDDYRVNMWVPGSRPGSRCSGGQQAGSTGRDGRAAEHQHHPLCPLPLTAISLARGQCRFCYRTLGQCWVLSCLPP